MSVWTKEQLDAINAENTGIIVSAAAGSGKTSVLVERLLRVLSDTENKLPADRLAVVTFTNDAAAQMKRRLTEAISARLAEEPDNLWLCSQQNLLQTAKISTIHSFCFDLIRENIQAAEVSAGFRILDGNEERLLMSKAADNVFELFYGEKPQLMETLAEFFSGSQRGDGELEEAMLKIYGFLISIPFYEDWLAAQTEKYSAGFKPESDPLAAAYLKQLERAYRKILGKAEYVQSVFEREFGRVSNAVDGDIDNIKILLNNLRYGSDWDGKTAVPEYKFPVFDTPRGLSEEEKAVKDKIKKIRDDYKKEYEKTVKSIFTEENIAEDYKRHGEILAGLSELIACFSEELKRLKSEKNALGFSDAEQLAVKLLAEKDGNIVKTALARELSDYYGMIMIDEFQDANNNQDLIFKLLSKGGTAEKGGTNLFAVGDVKQSIYRFRLANPKLFLDALSKSERYTGKDFSGTSAAVYLNRNFRSSGDVVGFVNYVFSLLMSAENGEVDYTQNEALVQGLEYPEGDRTTEIIVVPQNDEQSENAEDENGEEVAPISEARAAARKIKSMLGVRTVFERGTERPCEPKDFCILLRNKASAELYVKELEAAGIRAYTEEPPGCLRSREISALTALLAVIDNPMQDIPLTAALMSPMFMLTAEDMACLAAVKNGGENYFTVIKEILSGEREFEDDNLLCGKLERFMKTFEKLRYCAASQRLERLIRTVYDSTDLLSAVQVYKDGARKRANLRLLLDIAEEYEKNSGGGLSGFVRYVGTVIKRGGDFAGAASSSVTENVVSVKTIHKSKGLEYPFVFLCGTSVKFNEKDGAQRIQINSELGIGFKIQERKKLKLYNSFPREVIRAVNGSNAKSEELRLLYVALTRAREQLFITVPDCERIRKRIGAVRAEIAAAGGVTSAVASSAGSMLDWITAAMFVHPDGDWFRDGEILPLADSRVRVNVRKFEDGEDMQTEESAAENAKPDSETLKRLEYMFAYRCGSGLTDKAAKITVTEISKSGDGALYLRRPDFAAQYGGLTAAERGTAMHTFMQYADYSAAETDASAEADRLAERGLLSFEERDSLNIGQLRTFFGTELYKRMKKSGEIRREQKFLVKKCDTGLDDERLMEYNKDSMLQGIADCMFEENGEIILVDYKTDRVDDEGTLLSRYDLQLKLYGAALGRIFGKRVREAYLYSFALGRAVKAEI